MGEVDGRGTVVELLGVLKATLLAPPVEADRVMALVVNPVERGDHIGLLIQGRPSPGAFDLLASSIESRTRPQATVLLEWVLPGTEALRHYQGWDIRREAGDLVWRQLSPAEARTRPSLRPEQPLGDDPHARFES
jgi:hypothetical protein